MICSELLCLSFFLPRLVLSCFIRISVYSSKQTVLIKIGELTIHVLLRFYDSVLRLDMMWISTKKDLDLVEVTTLVIAQLSLHSVLDMCTLGVKLILSVVNLVDAYLGRLRYLLLTASTSLESYLIVLPYVSSLLHC